MTSTQLTYNQIVTQVTRTRYQLKIANRVQNVNAVACSGGNASIAERLERRMAQKREAAIFPFQAAAPTSPPSGSTPRLLPGHESLRDSEANLCVFRAGSYLPSLCASIRSHGQDQWRQSFLPSTKPSRNIIRGTVMAVRSLIVSTIQSLAQNIIHFLSLPLTANPIIINIADE